MLSIYLQCIYFKIQKQQEKKKMAKLRYKLNYLLTCLSPSHVLAVCQKTGHGLDRYDQMDAGECFPLDDCTQDLATTDSLPTWPRLNLQACNGTLHKTPHLSS